MSRKEGVKNFYLNNFSKILEIKKIVDTLDNSYIDFEEINPRELNSESISIIMTASNRSQQTYFTIETICKSEFKDFQIILVDDSTHQPIDKNKLREFNVYISFVQIKKKTWFNPCVNYNLGFKCIKGSKLIIQNGEVCHVGDILSQVNKNLRDNDYFVYDVMALKDMNCNYELYKLGTPTMENMSQYYKWLFMWYQHHQARNTRFHFLIATTKKIFDQMINFDFAYSLGCCYDDDDFLLSAEAANANFVLIKHEEQRIFGIHQWHATTLSESILVYNQVLFECKKNYYKKNKKYIPLISNKDEENGNQEIIFRINELFSDF